MIIFEVKMIVKFRVPCQ